MNPTHPRYALLAYAQEMHKYTLELWMEFTKKAERPDLFALPSKPDSDSSTSTISSETLPRSGAVVNDSAAPPLQAHS